MTRRGEPTGALDAPSGVKVRGTLLWMGVGVAVLIVASLVGPKLFLNGATVTNTPGSCVASQFRGNLVSANGAYELLLKNHGASCDSEGFASLTLPGKGGGNYDIAGTAVPPALAAKIGAVKVTRIRVGVHGALVSYVIFGASGTACTTVRKLEISLPGAPVGTLSIRGGPWHICDGFFTLTPLTRG